MRIIILCLLGVFGLFMSVLSGMFNAEGGYMIGAMLSDKFAISLQLTMIAIEVLIIISYAVHYLIDTSTAFRVITSLIVSGLSITCLSILFYTGIIDRANDLSRSGDNSSHEEEKRSMIHSQIVSIEKKIMTRKGWIKKEQDVLIFNNSKSRKINLEINKQVSITGGQCPSTKYRSRCKRIILLRQKLSNMGFSNSKIKELQSEIESLHDEIAEKRDVILKSKSSERKTRDTAEDNQSIIRFKPKEMELEYFAGLFSIIWAISLEFLKTLPILWFFKILLENQKTGQKKRMGAYGKISTAIVQKIRDSSEEKKRLSKIREKNRGKELAKLEHQEIINEKIKIEINDDSIFSIKTWMINIDVIKLNRFAGKSLQRRRVRTETDVLSAMTCLTLKTYEEEGQIKINELVNLLHIKHPESKGRGRLTYAMMRSKIIPLLVEDLKFIEKNKSGFFWRKEIVIIEERNRINTSKETPKLELVRNYGGGLHV